METEKEQIKLAYNQAIKYLAIREYGILELSNKLKNKEYTADIIDIVVKQLIEQNYLDEGRYTEIYCRSRMNRGYGRKRIGYELKQKGIKGSMIQNALAEIANTVWVEIINKQISKKVTDVPQSFPDKMKLFRALANRGFEHQEIQFAYKEFIENLKQ